MNPLPRINDCSHSPQPRSRAATPPHNNLAGPQPCRHEASQAHSLKPRRPRRYARNQPRRLAGRAVPHEASRPAASQAAPLRAKPAAPAASQAPPSRCKVRRAYVKYNVGGSRCETVAAARVSAYIEFLCEHPERMVGHVQKAVRDVCLWLPESEEYLSHGSPNYRVRGKGFASYVVNHHGDGRVALWLNALPGAQEHHVNADPRYFFVPPYVGPRGWLGVELNKGLAWKVIATLVREAYEKVAPAALRLQIGKTPVIKAPTQKFSASDIDPMQSARGKALLTTVRSICLRLPETREVIQFGYPVWQAGKKAFVWARCAEQRLTLNFWVGIDQQNFLTADQRFHIPAYMGHNGWIGLDVTEHCDCGEVTALTLQSYRHFALKRMLQSLPPVCIKQP